MPYQHIQVAPLTPTIGAEVSGLDLRQPLTPAQFDELVDAWMRHLVLFFRNQPVSNAQHRAFGERFGPLHIHPAAPFADDDPALMVIHADASSHRNNGGGWHTDVSADEAPPMASILRIHTVPSQGGDTLFASMYAAFDALSKPMQRFLEGLRAVHVANYDGYYGDHQPQRQNPRATHPVVRTHPVTGRSLLFVNRGFTRSIVGMTPAESTALLEFLFRHCEDPAFQCRFRWEQDSIAMWDDRCTQHRALWDYFPETRSGTRVTVQGDRPYFRP